MFTSKDICSVMIETSLKVAVMNLCNADMYVLRINSNVCDVTGEGGRVYDLLDVETIDSQVNVQLAVKLYYTYMLFSSQQYIEL